MVRIFSFSLLSLSLPLSDDDPSLTSCPLSISLPQILSDGDGIDHGSRFARSLGFYDISGYQQSGSPSSFSPESDSSAARRRDSLNDLGAADDADESSAPESGIEG